MNQTRLELRTREDLLQIAKYQKYIVRMILVSIATVAISPYSTILTGFVFWYFIGKLASSLRKTVWVYIILGFIPLLGSLGLLALSGAATKALRSNGIRVGLMGARMADFESAPSMTQEERRKRKLAWRTTMVLIPALAIVIYLIIKSGQPPAEPPIVYLPGQYFTVGSTKEEVLRIQGTPTLQTESVWFYDDSQVQFDSEGKVKWTWNASKNLKAKPAAWKAYAP